MALILSWQHPTQSRLKITIWNNSHTSTDFYLALMISAHLTMMTCIPWPALRVGDSLRGEPTCGSPTTAALTSGPFHFVCFTTQHQRLWRKIWQFVWPGWRPRLTSSDLVANWLDSLHLFDGSNYHSCLFIMCTFVIVYFNVLVRFVVSICIPFWCICCTKRAI